MFAVQPIPAFRTTRLAPARASVSKTYSPINPRGVGILNAAITKFDWDEGYWGEGPTYGFTGGGATITILIQTTDTDIAERAIHIRGVMKAATSKFISATYIGDLDGIYVDKIIQQL